MRLSGIIRRSGIRRCSQWKRSFVGSFTLIVLGVLLGGCAGSPQSRYYLLHSLPAAGAEEPGSTNGQAVVLGLGPISLPDYLDRPQIVTRTSLNELNLAEFDRWAEPLEKTFTRVLAENLSAFLATDRVAVFPWPSSMEVNHRIVVEVAQFEGIPGGKIALNVRWTLSTEGGVKPVMTRHSKFIEPVNGSGYEAIVAAESKALASLSVEIGTAIKSLQKQ